MSFKHKDLWFWDSWYVQDGDTLARLFPASAEVADRPRLARHLKATSAMRPSDLVNWTDLGTTFEPQRNGRPGTTARPGPGRWSGRRRAVAPVLHGHHARPSRALYQRVGHATSTDLHNWTGSATGWPGPDRAQRRLLRERPCHRPLARPGDARPLGDEGPGRPRLADVFHRPRARRGRNRMPAGPSALRPRPTLMTWTLQPPVFQRRLWPA